MSIDPTPSEPDNTTSSTQPVPVDKQSQDSAQMGLILGTSVAGFLTVVTVLIIVSAGVYRKLRVTHALANQMNGNTATLDGMYKKSFSP